MAVSVTSRYHGSTVYDAPGADGSAHATVPARFVPTPPPGTPWFHTVVAGETIESLAFRYLGASEAWWRIADANPGLAFPAILTPGSALMIPTGVDPGLVVRTRSF
ncbi:MAG: tail protein X [Acidimicrobiales bacterium]